MEEKKKRSWGLPPNSEPPFRRAGGYDRPNDPKTKRLDLILFLLIIVAMFVLPMILPESTTSSRTERSYRPYITIALLLLWVYFLYKRRNNR